MWRGCILFVLLSFAVSDIIVHTPSGLIRGFSNNGLRLFFGIPYAEPPVRFGLSELKQPWSGVLNATSFGPVCWQLGTLPPPLNMSENCLSLNIYTPMDVTTPLPVMVWVHGGSFKTGSGSIYDATHIAQHGVIAVTINYRLGALGYFQSKEIRNENPDTPTLGGYNGVIDIITSLKWINANIASFGGDTQSITVFGESAGSLALNVLVTMSQASGLYHRVIMESGSNLGPWGPAPSIVGLQKSSQLMLSLNVSTLAGLRALPVHTLLSSPYYANIGPSVDDFFVTRPIISLYEMGSLYIPKTGSILTGSNNLDTLFGFPWYNGPFPTTNDTYKAAVAKYFGPDVDEVINIYPPLPSPKVAYQTINAHLCVSCPTRLTAQYTSLLWPVYLYEFSFNSDPNLLNLAGHFAEVPEVFGGVVPPWTFNADLSEYMMEYWTSFARSGVPVSQKSGVTWPKYGNTGNYLNLNMKITQNIRFLDTQCEFWKQYISKGSDNLLKTEEFCFQSLI